MPLQDAINFINRFVSDKNFRDDVFTQENKDVLSGFLMSNDYKFTYPEFEDAYRRLKLNCRDEFEASKVEEVYQCYRMLIS